MREPYFKEDKLFQVNWFVLPKPWDDEIKAYILNNDIDSLYLFGAQGWSGQNLEFLKDVNYLKGFRISDSDIADISGVHYLTNLQVLLVNTTCKTKINFDLFPKLRKCYFYWRKGCESLFNCKLLDYLWLYEYSGKEFSIFSKLTNMDYLSLIRSRFENLTGIQSLKKLEALQILNRQLNSIEPLGDILTLECLFLNGCKKIDDISVLAKLPNLRKLAFDNMAKINSLTPLANCKKLESIVMAGDTNIVDGDFTWVADMPNFKIMKFSNRRHYSHKWKELSPDWKD